MEYVNNDETSKEYKFETTDGIKAIVVRPGDTLAVPNNYSLISIDYTTE